MSPSDRDPSVEPLALERCGVVVVFSSVAVTGEWCEAEPQLAVYHAQPRDAAGQELTRSDDAEAFRDLLHETLAFGHACVAEGTLTAYDLTDPSIVAGLYLQTSLLLIARWPNPISLYSAAQLAEMRFSPEADVLHVLLRHAAFPALWRVEMRTGDGKLMRVYELGQDLWRAAQEQARERKAQRTRAKRSGHADKSPLAWSPSPLDMLQGLGRRLAEQRRALAATATSDDTFRIYQGPAEELQRLISAQPAPAQPAGDAAGSPRAASPEPSAEPAEPEPTALLSAEELTRLRTLRARLDKQHRLNPRDQ